jgi:hypothetical protein
MRCLVASLLLLMDGGLVLAQSFATPLLVGRGNEPLSIVNASPVGQPIRLSTGPGGVTLGIEVGGTGEITIPLRVGIGQGVGAAPTERLRIGKVPAAGGTGVAIDMLSSDSSTGLRIERVGVTGVDHAGVVISSDMNGIGTGIRLGGPAGGTRPTLGTGIDITGGTGLRYSALTAGSGTAIDIGSTMAPRRGIDVTTSGTEHIGGIFRANMLGTGLVGMSVSSSYADPPHEPRIGVRGFAATNANTAADVIIGVKGHVLRGGNGGTNTTSIGVDALSITTGSSHGGLVIGARAAAMTSGAGTTAAIGLVAEATGAPGLAIGVRSGDVFLGGASHGMPAGIPATFTQGIGPLTNITYMHDARVSGTLSLQRTTSTVHMRSYGAGTAMLEWPPLKPPIGSVLTVTSVVADTVRLGWSMPRGPVMNHVLPLGGANILPVDGTCVLRIMADAVGSGLAGLQPGADGAVVTVIVTDGSLVFINESLAVPAADRILTNTGGDVQVFANAAATLWYDVYSQRWRLISYVL